MTARLRLESGQVLVTTALFLTVLLGGTAMTLDVGAWYREHRQAQTTADAAALAAAQSLPGDTAGASALAQSYAAKNGSGIDAVGGITFRTDYEPNDVVTVKVTRPTPGFFSSIFGIVTPNVHAKAAARSTVPSQATGVAPIAVNNQHPYLTGAACPANNGQPCFDQETTIPLDKSGAPGSFALVNLDQNSTGTTGASTVADWMLNGFSGYLPLGAYLSDPGAKWNNNGIDSALDSRMSSNPTMLVPVYDTLTLQGANAQYHIIGWAAFAVDSYVAKNDKNGPSGSVTGKFKEVIWDGIQSNTGPGGPDYGVHSVALVN
jgi:hypothetical protein